MRYPIIRGAGRSIKAALAIELKEQMGTDNMHRREVELLKIAFRGLDEIPGLKILADNVRERLGIISFYIEGIHYNLIVQLLNDLYGIQTRGGCVCAGTYGHFLLEVSYEKSREITDKINHGDLSEKPGWVRWSLHPTMTDEEVQIMIAALKDITGNIDKYRNDYLYDSRKNIFWHKNDLSPDRKISDWFSL
jgi:selenocysteine lyase/cysteine desulfurase